MSKVRAIAIKCWESYFFKIFGLGTVAGVGMFAIVKWVILPMFPQYPELKDIISIAMLVGAVIILIGLNLSIWRDRKSAKVI
jgi:hypothetical protein